MSEKIIQRYVQKYSSQTSGEAILRDLFWDEELQSLYASPIRRATIAWQLANHIFEILWNPNRVSIYAIGDIAYFGSIQKLWENLVKNALQSIDPNSLIGYDLTGIGSQKLRSSLTQYSHQFYQFPEKILSVLPDKITPCYGSSDAFFMTLDTLAKHLPQNTHFYYPEASFMINVGMAQELGWSMCPIKKPSEQNFFVTPSQIDEIYRWEGRGNVFYFTSVGNPTGEKISQLFEVVRTILSYDETAIILMDNVYVGLLTQSVSSGMFEEIFWDEKILSSIIFCESLSKTLGCTGIRIGWVWTFHPFFHEEVRKNVISKKAWFSKLIDQFWIGLLWDIAWVNEFQKSAYAYFDQKRKSFYALCQERYAQYFDFTASAQVYDHEGIYLFLKLQPSYTALDVFSVMGVIGVEVMLSDGVYVRYAFGNVA